MFSHSLLGLIAALTAFSPTAGYADSRPDSALSDGASALAQPGPPSGSLEPGARREALGY
jgi:hypothetical protein